MKIERINENSIRCTLTSFDLSVRDLNIRELAYGTEKVRKLFREMMIQANNEVGFEAENTPLMIEAVPMVGDSIQLIITKVDDPEELDTRFSKFSPSPKQTSAASDWLRKFASEVLEGVNQSLQNLQQGGTAEGKKTAGNESEKQEAPQPAAADAADFRVFAFESLDRTAEACRMAAFFPGQSTLYKRDSDKSYILVLREQDCTGEEFSKACNIIAEYGRKLPAVQSTLAYFDEHYKLISGNGAVRKLSLL